MEKRHIDLNGKTILVTGSPGFIGAALVQRLLQEMNSGSIISLDSMNDYYEVSLKEWRLKQIEETASQSSVSHLFLLGNLADSDFLMHVFDEYRPAVVVNLAAQAGVRYSIDHPEVYMESNVTGFFHLLEACRRYPVEHLVYASSSSVYGGNLKVPFCTEDRVDFPVSLYAATKKSAELLAHCYSALYSIPTTGLRFFTVYGPAGRPDMFYYSATRSLVSGGNIRVFNYGNCQRDFTYIDDTVEGICRVMKGAPLSGSNPETTAPCAVYNIGGGHPVNLLEFVTILEEELVRTGLLPPEYDFDSHHEFISMQPGDVPITFADCMALKQDYGFCPSVPLRIGLQRFVHWYRDYYQNT